MNAFDKSESIKAGVWRGFLDGRSKIARCKCHGYAVNTNQELKR